LPRFIGNTLEIPASLPDDDLLFDRLGIRDDNLLAQTRGKILKQTHSRGELFTLQIPKESNPWQKLCIECSILHIFQIRKFGFIFRNTFGKILAKREKDDGGIMTAFQAATTSLAGTVGMGNIAGVATALSIGGPGAIFWMWLLAFFGMILKIAEITLGVHYREVDEKGNYFGGPMYYIRKGLGWKTLAKVFSVCMIINAIIAATLLQPHTVGRAFLKNYSLDP